jgi:glycosyltransferase involved in cell wall biosynthesis
VSGRSVVYIQYANSAAYPPIQHSAEILAQHGWRVLVRGTELLGQTGMLFSNDSRIDVRLAPAVRRGWRQKLHYFRFCIASFASVVRRGRTWVYVSDALASPVGLLTSLLPGVRVIYHEHDTPSPESSSAFMRGILAARRALLHRCDAFVVPNAARGSSVLSTTGAVVRMFCIWNCPPRSEVAQQPHVKPASNDFWLVYHGSLVPVRLPMTVLDALKQLPPTVKLRISAFETGGHFGYADALRTRAAELELTERVDMRLCPPREEFLAAARASHLGLSLMPTADGDVNERNMTGASNKAFEYLAQGVPLLVSNLPDWIDMFVSAGFGRACQPESADSLAEAIAWFLSHRDEAAQMGEAGRQKTFRCWNYDEQFRPLLEFMTA